MKTPLVLMILDGWGIAPASEHNAISRASTPHWDTLWERYPHTLLDCSGETVGLPALQMGNSEVGHMHIGAGRVMAQDLLRLDQAIADQTFATNPIIQAGLTQAKQHTLHIMGLLSAGGVHSSEQHILHLIHTAKQAGVERIMLHAFLDGRDTPPQCAQESLQKMALLNTPQQRIATICGRYYAMDRDQRWERTEQAYNLIANGVAKRQAADPSQALAMAYENGETDEFVAPTLIGEPVPIQDNDTVIFMNFRADRTRQLCHAFLDSEFDYFSRPTKLNTHFISLTEYARDLPTKIAFPTQRPSHCLGEIIAAQGWPQLRMAETEKYAHVTFFFNGGREQPYANEDRQLIPSPKVATYDLKPEMSAVELTDALLLALSQKDYPFVVVNFANADMVGHSGNFLATVKAIECVDQCIGRIIQALQRIGGECLITADHGNAELLFDEAHQQPHTSHTRNPVPLLYVGRSATMPASGSLLDIAPTILSLLELATPDEMTGNNLITLD